MFHLVIVAFGSDSVANRRLDARRGAREADAGPGLAQAREVHARRGDTSESREGATVS